MHALGAYVPEEVISNQQLETLVDTSSEWIISRTGIESRRRLAPEQNASDLGYEAAREALAASGLEPAQISHVIAATTTPDYMSPSVAAIIAGRLGTPHAMAFDFSAACSGFIYGLSIAGAFLARDAGARVLLVCTEALSRRVNWQDRSTCVLFGDGATACVLDANPHGARAKIIDVICHSDGTQKDLITVGGGSLCRYAAGEPVGEDFFIAMKGHDTYKFAVRNMVAVCEELLSRNGLGIDDISLFVPHQANIRIIEAVGARLKIDRVFTNVARYGNTSAASIPLALWEAQADGSLKPGALVMITGFGAGLTWGAALLRF